MKVPPLEECEMLMKQYGVPEHIRGHSETVRKVANFLAQKMSSKGVKVDLVAVERAALMHDFMKMHCIQNNCKHAKEAGEILANRGYREFGEIIRLHSLDEVLGFNPETPIEGKILWYADKRVTHDKVASLRERFDYLKQRYGSQSKEKLAEIISAERASFDEEKELLALSGTSEDLEGLQ